jgi:hypothetical protein
MAILLVLIIRQLFFTSDVTAADPAMATPLSTGPGLANIDLVDEYQSRVARYFYEQVIGPGYMTPISPSFAAIASP